MNQPSPRRDPAAIGRRNRMIAFALVGVAVLFYLAIQWRWGWSR
jgi:hypothetical protein